MSQLLRPRVLSRGKKNATVGIEITEYGYKETDRILAQMPIELRDKVLSSALRAAANVVVRKARQYAPAPGYEGDNPSKMSLRQSIAVKVKRYQKTVTAFIGPRRPWGAHGHLIEYGFTQRYVRIGSTNVKVKRKEPKAVPRRPFMRPAAIATQDQQSRTFINALRKGIGKLA